MKTQNVAATAKTTAIAKTAKSVTPKVEAPVIAPVVAEKPAKAEKVVRVPIVVTLEQALKTIEEAKPTVGSICNFQMMGEIIWRTGEVTTITHDKRNNRVFYRIFDADGKMYHKTVGSVGFNIDEEASMKLSIARAEAKAAKEEAKAALALQISNAKEAAKVAKEELAAAIANAKAAYLASKAAK